MENIPSLSWFRFQFWPENSYTNAAITYTGQLKVRYMVQQRNIRKFSPEDHYCAALYKNVRCLAVQIKEYSATLGTDDKCKIKFGKSNFLIAAGTHRKQVLVARGTFIHDMSCITLVPTVVLNHDIPDNLDQS